MGTLSKHGNISVGTSSQQQQNQQRRSVRQSNPSVTSNSGIKSNRSSPPPAVVNASTSRQLSSGGNNVSTRGGTGRITNQDADNSTRRKTRSGGVPMGGSSGKLSLADE